jgi:hypothetical protein
MADMNPFRDTFLRWYWCEEKRRAREDRLGRLWDRRLIDVTEDIFFETLYLDLKVRERGRPEEKVTVISKKNGSNREHGSSSSTRSAPGSARRRGRYFARSSPRDRISRSTCPAGCRIRGLRWERTSNSVR